MSSLGLILAAGAGGALGAVARYLVSVGFARWGHWTFPWATLTVNVLGCLVMGLAVGLFLRHWPEAAAWRVFIATGILGGFTTFSAFSLEVIALAERGETTAAAAYVLLSVVLSVGACLAGLMAIRALAP